mgnify:CR=1 FL=1
MQGVSANSAMFDLAERCAGVHDPSPGERSVRFDDEPFRRASDEPSALCKPIGLEAVFDDRGHAVEEPGCGLVALKRAIQDSSALPASAIWVEQELGSVTDRR